MKIQYNQIMTKLLKYFFKIETQNYDKIMKI